MANTVSLFQVDALLENLLQATLQQSVAAEMNLSETAFVRRHLDGLKKLDGGI